MSSPRATSSAHTLDDDDLVDPIDHLLILYASETGNSQDVAERLGREVRRRGGRCVLLSMDTFDVLELIHVPLVVFITSTHGNGDPPPSMVTLWNALLRKGLPEDILEDVNFALYGLGDTSYDRFAYAAKLLNRRLLDLGAHPINEPVYGDERAPDGYEETLGPWMAETVELVLPHLSSSSSDPWDVKELGMPIYRMEWVDEGARLDDLADGVQKLAVTTDDHRETDHANGNADISAAPTRQDDAVHGIGGVYKPDDWGWATLVRNERVTRDDWWQEVREIEFELDNHSQGYAPASIANLSPRSSPSEVQEFLESQDLLDVADRPFVLSSNLCDQPLPLHLPPSHRQTSLRELLLYHLDIRASPRKSFFEWMRRVSGDEREQERLDEFIADPDEIHTYATRPSRAILETLADFRFTRLPMSHLIEILPPLRRRQFSIASSWGSHPGKVQLLVAIVEYKTNLKAPRRGLCSSWIKELAVGSRVPIKISPPTLHLPNDNETPVVLIGPGTGVAPMKALMEERVRQGAASNTVLYFGCRSIKADLFFASSLAKWAESGARIRIAASRDQADKVYVQDLIRQDAALIREWVYTREGWVYICGSSGAMPKAVREAIAWCISKDGGGELEMEEATSWVDAGFEEGRGGEESW